MLRAAQVAVDEMLARPMLVGRPAVIERKIKELGLRLVAERTTSSLNLRRRRYDHAGCRGILPSWAGAVA